MIGKSNEILLCFNLNDKNNQKNIDDYLQILIEEGKTSNFNVHFVGINKEDNAIMGNNTNNNLNM